MSQEWKWPGSRWWRVDLHAHSPASADFRDANSDENDWQRWLQAASNAGLHAVAVTDHNSAAAISSLQSARSGLQNPPVLFPGVEITATDGVHILALMSPDKGQRDVQHLLAQVGVRVEDQGTSQARSKLGAEQILEKLGKDTILIAAHVNKQRGVLTTQGGEQRLAVLQHPHLSAVEVVEPVQDEHRTWLDGSKPQVGRLSQIWSSDAHEVKELGRRFTWVKMTQRDFQGLRLALLDGHTSLKPAMRSAPGNPNADHGEMLIEQIEVSNARFMGRGEAMKVQFNPWLNTIIGGRGTGKSTLVDFCLKTMRRDEDLARDQSSGDLRRLKRRFDRRLRVTDSTKTVGLVTADTSVEIVYRKHGQRFKIAWSIKGNGPPISRILPSGIEREGGRIYERFPVRIFGQKQLFAMAQDPDSLHTIIDDSPDVRGVDRKRRIERLKSDYLSLQAQARAAREQATALVSRTAELRDVRNKLDFLQTGKQAAQMAEYRRRARYDDAWQAVVQFARNSVSDLADATDELSVPDLDFSGPNSGNSEAVEDLRTSHIALRHIIGDLKRTVRDRTRRAQQEIDRIQTGEPIQRWQSMLKKSKLQFRDASSALVSQGIPSPESYRGLVGDVARLKREIQGLDLKAQRARQLEQEAAQTLKGYREECKRLGEVRNKSAKARTDSTIRIEIGQFSKTEGLPNWLSNVIGVSGTFENDCKALARQVQMNDEQNWNWDGLDALVSKIREFRSDPSNRWDAEDWRFERVLRDLAPEALDRLALYVPDDTVKVQFRDAMGHWRSLTHGSPGQQTAALLAFVLRHGDEPIVLDQPEDDLDSSLIYELLVSELKKAKHRRQVIVVTHNPNVVVHGDAEFVLSLTVRSGQSHTKCQGGLQEQAVRDEICKVMEGGKEAFESRYRRIMTSVGPTS